MPSQKAFGVLFAVLGGASIVLIGALVWRIQPLHLVTQYSTTSILLSFLAGAFVLWNAKCLPFAYHTRILTALLPSLLHPTNAEEKRPPLFHTHIMQSHCPPLELDYNMHKSNSTYFSDLDVCRSAFLAELFIPGLRRMNARGRSCYVALGSVQCTFAKPITPGAGYELRTRVLSWDHKWLYLITHFVRPGAIKTEGSLPADGTRRDVFASALAKYVFKEGKKTVRPEVVLEASGLLPAKKENALDVDGELWQECEARRKQGEKYAIKFVGLDDLVAVV